MQSKIEPQSPQSTQRNKRSGNAECKVKNAKLQPQMSPRSEAHTDKHRFSFDLTTENTEDTKE